MLCCLQSLELTGIEVFMSSSTFNVADVFTEGLRVDSAAKSVSVIPRLDPKCYAKVKSIINRIGGTWSTADQVFYFDQAPQGKIDRVLECGTRTLNRFQLYPTPEYVWQAIETSTPIDDLFPGERPLRVLEPSMGTGSLAEYFSAFAERGGISFELDGYDIDPLNVALCEERWDVTEADFLKVTPDPIYDLILMNPPFKGQEYIKHILHAQKFLSEYGRLIAVTPTGWTQYDVEATLSRTLYGKAVANSSEFMNGDGFFSKDTFSGASIETTLCILDSVSQEQAYLASSKAVDFAVWSFDLFVSNSQVLHEKRNQLAQRLSVAGASDVTAQVADFVESSLQSAMAEGVHINRYFVRDIIRVEFETHCSSVSLELPVDLSEQTALCF